MKLLNKAFFCSDCGKKVDSDRDYYKISVTRVAGGKKMMERFCSVRCLDRWNAVHLRELPAQTSLEEELRLGIKTGSEDAAIMPAMTDVTSISYMTSGSENGHKPGYVKLPHMTEYKTYVPRQEEVPKAFDQLGEAKQDMADINSIKSGYVYDKGGSGIKELRTMALTTWEKFRDKLKALKIIYDRDGYK